MTPTEPLWGLVPGSVTERCRADKSYLLLALGGRWAPAGPIRFLGPAAPGRAANTVTKQRHHRNHPGNELGGLGTLGSARPSLRALGRHHLCSWPLAGGLDGFSKAPPTTGPLFSVVKGAGSVAQFTGASSLSKENRQWPTLATHEPRPVRAWAGIHTLDAYWYRDLVPRAQKGHHRTSNTVAEAWWVDGQEGRGARPLAAPPLAPMRALCPASLRRLCRTPSFRGYLGFPALISSPLQPLSSLVLRAVS